ncbi:embryonic polyadenylate-binding protein 2 [Tamandua tetradactyla]|uniref:embryonic polyadenylate-binding protein 2 n=1 Tax=Tamandua tetradactyla TaxID=48850 RepID=UPI0040547810
MWPFLSRTLFPPPTEAWLQSVSSDPEAQGWGACNRAEKTPLGAGDQEEEEEEEDGDAGFPLSLLERETLAEGPGPDEELEAIKLRLRAMEQAQWLPGEPDSAWEEEEAPGATPKGQLLSPEPGRLFPGTPESVEADHRSVYVGNVDYGGTAEELEAHFHPCGDVHRVTILCDKFSGHPKGYAYIEFAAESSARAAMELDESIFRGRVIKVLPKRTNLPGISSTDRGGLRGRPGPRAGLFLHSSRKTGPRLRAWGRGRNRVRGRLSPWIWPY